MRYSDFRGITARQWFPNQMLRSDAVNRSQADVYKNILDTLVTLTPNRDGRSTALRGLELTHDNLMTCTLHAGVVLSHEGYYLTANSWGFVSDSDASFMVWVPDSIQVPFTPDGVGQGNPRVDAVVIRPTRENVDDVSASFKDPITGIISSSPVPGGYNYTYEFDVLTGTPAASPTAPATTAGWVKVAEVYIDDGTTALTTADLRGVDRSDEWTTEVGSVVRDIFSEATTFIDTVTFEAEAIFGSLSTFEGPATFNDPATFEDEATFNGPSTFEDAATFKDSVTIETPPSADSHAVRMKEVLPIGLFANKTIRRQAAHIAKGWYIRNVPEDGYRSVTWAPEIGTFCAVSDLGTYRVATSTNGDTWIPRTVTPYGYWADIAWSPELGIFCAVSMGGSYNVMTSTDGVTWTGQTAPASGWESIVWSPELGIFCAVAFSGIESVMTSTDGITWDTRTPSEANEWNCVTWSPELGIFCAVAGGGTNRAMTSSDGISWNSQPLTGSAFRSVTWSPELGIFCAVAIDGANRVVTSSDGTSWFPSSVPEANQWSSVIWSPELGIFCAVATTGDHRVMTSYDGITWTSRPSAYPNYWGNVAWSPTLGMFAAIAFYGDIDSGRLMVSRKWEDCT